MIMSLVRKNILITGASRGLGHYLARYFWDKGSNVILVAKNSDLLHHVLDDLSVRHGQKFDYFPCDLSNESSVQSLIEKVKDFRIDAVINNAAIQGPIGSLPDNSWDDWKKTIQVNLLTPVYICRALLPQLLEHGSSIINLSGGGATGPRANFTAYATSKCGLVRFSETLAEELKETKVRVNCIAPGPMQTDMLREVVAVGNIIAGEKEFKTAEKVFSENLTSFFQVAELCGFLTLEQSIGITGKLISAIWDPWEEFDKFSVQLRNSDIGTLRRIVPEDRGQSWDSLATTIFPNDGKLH
jgi:NAD(P)-dependent dehydrogenase (short-subunit alcohol dehydrogenase family)